MKKLLLTLAFAGISMLSYGQGSVVFQTDNSPNAQPWGPRIYSDLALTTPAFGTGYYAQLYAADGAGASAASLVAVGNPVNLRGTSAASATAGYVQISGTPVGAAANVLVAKNVNVTSGSEGVVTLQIRAWSSAYATYDLAKNNGGAYGQSATFTFTPAYSPNLPGTANSLFTATGVQGFAVTAVPEPSTIALGVMGLSALLFRRRK